MPIYEYRCAACSKVSSILVRSPKTAAKPACQHCGSKQLKKLISAAARRKSVSDVINEYGAPNPGEAYRDPRQIGQWAEKRFEQMGVEMPESSRKLIDAARDGVFPDETDI